MAIGEANAREGDVFDVWRVFEFTALSCRIGLFTDLHMDISHHKILQIVLWLFVSLTGVINIGRWRAWPLRDNRFNYYSFHRWWSKTTYFISFIIKINLNIHFLRILLVYKPLRATITNFFPYSKWNFLLKSLNLDVQAWIDANLSEY